MYAGVLVLIERLTASASFCMEKDKSARDVILHALEGINESIVHVPNERIFVTLPTANVLLQC